MRTLACIAALLVATSAAYAESNDPDETTRVAASGAAPADATDARTKAIDRAFANAVDTSVVDIVPADLRTKHRGDIRDRIVRRARLYIARYKVREEGDDGQVYRVRLDAWIDTGKLRQALASLGIELAGDRPAGGAPAVQPGSRVRPTILLISLTNVDGAASASFGRDGGDGGALGRAIARELGEHGFEVIGAPGVAPPVSETAGTSLPVSDSAAAEMAREVGAGGVVVVGAEVFRDGKVRGTRLLAAGARGRARVIDLDEGVSVADETVEVGYYADTAEVALDAGAVELGRRVVLAVAGSMKQHWPAAVVAEASVVVEITGATMWKPVLRTMRALKKAPGVTAVEPRRFRAGSISLEVTTSLSAARVAKAIVGAKFDRGTVEVRTAGDHRVRVEISPAPPASIE